MRKRAGGAKSALTTATVEMRAHFAYPWLSQPGIDMPAAHEIAVDELCPQGPLARSESQKKPRRFRNALIDPCATAMQLLAGVNGRAVHNISLARKAHMSPL